MAAVANSPKFAKKVGVPQSVGKEFAKADKAKESFFDGTTAYYLTDAGRRLLLRVTSEEARID